MIRPLTALRKAGVTGELDSFLMNRIRIVCSVMLIAGLGLAFGPGSRAQDNPAAAHGRRVLDLLLQDKFDEIAKEFNAKMAAALTPAQLGSVWTAMRQQVGGFQSVITNVVATPAAGITLVTIGCQFEKAAVNLIVAFDAEDKIAGLRFAPRLPPSEPSTPPGLSKFTEEPVAVGAGDWMMPGTLTLPLATITAAVVLVHGSGPHDRDETIGPNKPFRDLAWGLADRGIAGLRYEKRTRRFPGKISNASNYTVREETIDDALQAVALVRKHARIDPKRIFVLGHSLGGTLAPRIAADDRSIAGLIIMAGTTRPLLEVAREQLAYLDSLKPGTINQEQALEMMRRSAPESYWKDFDAYKPADAAAKLTLPLLILQGERDYQVTSADLQGWRDALRDRANVTIKTYPTLNHLFLAGEGKSTPAEYERAGRIPDAVLDDIAGWIRAR